MHASNILPAVVLRMPFCVCVCSRSLESRLLFLLCSSASLAELLCVSPNGNRDFPFLEALVKDAAKRFCLIGS